MRTTPPTRFLSSNVLRTAASWGEFLMRASAAIGTLGAHARRGQHFAPAPKTRVLIFVKVLLMRNRSILASTWNTPDGSRSSQPSDLSKELSMPPARREARRVGSALSSGERKSHLLLRRTMLTYQSRCKMNFGKSAEQLPAIEVLVIDLSSAPLQSSRGLRFMTRQQRALIA